MTWMVDLEEQDLSHLVVALGRYRRHRRDLGMGMPAALAELQDRCASRVRAGQDGSSVADLADLA